MLIRPRVRSEVSEREWRIIGLCSELSTASFRGTSLTIRNKDINQLLDDLREVNRERNQLEDEVLYLSSLVLGEGNDRLRTEELPSST